MALQQQKPPTVQLFGSWITILRKQTKVCLQWYLQLKQCVLGKKSCLELRTHFFCKLAFLDTLHIQAGEVLPLTLWWLDDNITCSVFLPSFPQCIWDATLCLIWVQVRVTAGVMANGEKKKKENDMLWSHVDCFKMAVGTSGEVI